MQLRHNACNLLKSNNRELKQTDQLYINSLAKEYKVMSRALDNFLKESENTEDVNKSLNSFTHFLINFSLSLNNDEFFDQHTNEDTTRIFNSIELIESLLANELLLCHQTDSAYLENEAISNLLLPYFIICESKYAKLRPEAIPKKIQIFRLADLDSINLILSNFFSRRGFLVTDYDGCIILHDSYSSFIFMESELISLKGINFFEIIDSKTRMLVNSILNRDNKNSMHTGKANIKISTATTNEIQISESEYLHYLNTTKVVDYRLSLIVAIDSKGKVSDKLLFEIKNSKMFMCSAIY